MAQVFPMLMLALVWESRFLQRLQSSPRRHRSIDPVSGVAFWTKPRVRVWTITVVGVCVAEIAMISLVLAGMLPDSGAMRGAVLAGLAVVLGTIITRAVVDIVDATARDVAHMEGRTSRDLDPD